MKTWLYYIGLIKKNDHQRLQTEIKRNPSVPFLTNEEGRTLLMMSSLYHAYDSTFVLIEAGSHINKKDNEGETALLLATANKNLDMTRYLLEYGADFSIRNNKDESAFEMAMTNDLIRKKHKWLKIFEPYADQLDERDLILYKEHRLITLFWKKD